MFKSARIKLTIWYLVIIMAITGGFSLFVYSQVSFTTQRALENHEQRINRRLRDFRSDAMPPPRFQQEINAETIKEIQQNVTNALIIINLLILVGAGSLGYFLAGVTLKPIEEMVEKQKRFIADAAHEFKTPLTSIKTYLEVTLRDKKLDLPEAKNSMKIVIEDIDELNVLVNNLVKQSKHQEMKDQPKEDIDIKKTLDLVIKKLTPKAKEKKLEILFEGDSDKKSENIPSITGNKKDLQELFTILIDNAVKFTDEGSINVKIKTTKSSVIVQIIDTGIGIDKKELPKIFDRFYKADYSRSIQEGHGLGLSIANDIAQKHNAKINVTSEKGKGSTFEVVLPRN